MGHVILTVPLVGWFVTRKQGLNVVYLCTKFDNSSFSRTRDIIGGPQNLKWVTRSWPRPS